VADLLCGAFRVFFAGLTGVLFADGAFFVSGAVFGLKALDTSRGGGIANGAVASGGAIAVLVAAVGEAVLFGADTKLTIVASCLFASDAGVLSAKEAATCAILVLETSHTSQAGEVALGGRGCALLGGTASLAAELGACFTIFCDESFAYLAGVAVGVAFTRFAAVLFAK